MVIGAGGVVHEPPLQGMVHAQQLAEPGGRREIEQQLPDERKAHTEHQGDDGPHEEQAEGGDADQKALPAQELGHRREQPAHGAADDGRRHEGGPLVVHGQDAHRHRSGNEGPRHQGEGLPRHDPRFGEQVLTGLMPLAL